MRLFVAVLVMLCVPQLAISRPWCSASGLNPTERTICGNAVLRNLDAELATAYRSAKARNKDYGQLYWLRNERDACGYRVSCIEHQYVSRINILRNRAARVIVENSRPWCSASRLNPTERTICATSYLRDYDATLQFVYGQARARNQDYGQLDWLRNQRDACGTNSGCISARYQERIATLRQRLTPYRSVTPPRGSSSCSRDDRNVMKAVCIIGAVGHHACASKLADELGAGALQGAGAGAVCSAAISGMQNGSIDPDAMGLSIVSGFLSGAGDSLLGSDDPFEQGFGVLLKLGAIGTSVVSVVDCLNNVDRVCR